MLCLEFTHILQSDWCNWWIAKVRSCTKTLYEWRQTPFPGWVLARGWQARLKGSLCSWLSRVSPPLPVSYASWFARAIAAASTLDESEPFVSGEPSSHCKYSSRAILAVLAACVTVWLIYVNSWYMCYLFVVKNIMSEKLLWVEPTTKIFQQRKFSKLR